MNFNQLIKQINYFAKIQRNRETYFEYLVRAYLQNEPIYQNEFAHVWMLSDVSEKFNIPKLISVLTLWLKNLWVN